MQFDSSNELLDWLGECANGQYPAECHIYTDDAESERSVVTLVMPDGQHICGSVVMKNFDGAKLAADLVVEIAMDRMRLARGEVGRG